MRGPPNAHSRASRSKCVKSAISAHRRKLLSSRIDFERFLSDISVMTEFTNKIDEMPPALRRFVLQWGDMGGQWGVNRTVAQIHALLYMSERPMNAEEIAESLGVARSNVSNSLKELLGFKIVERIPIPGDRRDHFKAETDVWEVAFRIAEVRKQREIDPAMKTLMTCLAEADEDSRVSPVQRQRLEDMHQFLSIMDRWYGQMLKVPSKTLLRMIKMGDRIVSLVGLGRKSKETAD